MSLPLKFFATSGAKVVRSEEQAAEELAHFQNSYPSDPRSFFPRIKHVSLPPLAATAPPRALSTPHRTPHRNEIGSGGRRSWRRRSLLASGLSTIRNSSSPSPRHGSRTRTRAPSHRHTATALRPRGASPPPAGDTSGGGGGGVQGRREPRLWRAAGWSRRAGRPARKSPRAGQGGRRAGGGRCGASTLPPLAPKGDASMAVRGAGPACRRWPACRPPP